MYAVGRIGSYISRGVYKVSGPFHPFGGAVDIIVVQQPDGSFKSSPWYVRFGKFQGVLKTREKIVRINVNGVEADFHMYLDHKGEAYFLKEVDVDEGESVLLYPSSSGDETDGVSNGSNDSKRRTLESQSCNFDGTVINPMDQIDSSNGKIVARSGSRRARLLGLVFGRRSMKKDGYNVEEGGGEDIARLSSLERAEIAADLLEVKWSTNLASNGFNKDTVASEISKGTLDDYMAIVQSDGELTQVDSSVCDDGKSCRDCSVLQAEIGSTNEQIAIISQSTLMNTEGSVAGIASMISGTIVDKKCEVVSESNKSDDFGVTNGGHGEDGGEIFCGSEVKHNLETHNLIYCETSESSMVGLNASNEQMQEALYVAGERCGEIHVRVDTLHVKPEQPSEDTDIEKEKSIELEKEVVDVSQNHFVRKTGCDPASGLVEELKSQDIDTNPEVQDKKSTIPESIANARMPDKPASDLFSGSSEDEHFLFSHLDESKLSVVRPMDSSSPDCLKKDNDSAQTAEGTKDSEFCPSPDMFIKDNQAADFGNNSETLRVISTPIAILRTQKNGEEVGRLAESLPNMWTPTFRVGVLDHHPLSHSMSSNAKSSKPALLDENDSSNMDSATDKEQPLAEEKHNGDSLKTVVPSGGSWRLWPFPFRRSGSSKAMQPVPVDSQSSGAEIAFGSINTNEPDTEIASEERSDTVRPSEEVTTESISGTDGAKNLATAAVGKKMVRSITPTSEQLASLNLKEGRNLVTFTFSTAMLGKQQVDANIYLWKWNTRIVISDVDGTITKSDVLGQFMPLVGMDWSQTGVAHLFSAIKENGYQLLFLSARAISQAYHTRQFLFNLKQDGKALPDGPVVISPDGLFPSLFREVIRRAPHEFKIACLEKIRDLFPSDCSPFYAGFGNRDTDELSYLKVGIPRGKIFTINPKGEVAVNRRVDTKSYSSLHSLVHGMFPPTASSEQEDFNSWNYWKLPQQGIDF